MEIIAKTPFRFYSVSSIVEITGKTSSNLAELLADLKTAEPSSIFYHTHQGIWEFHFLRETPANDFAHWVNSALGDKFLAEQLASIDVREYVDLEGLRQKLVSVLESYLAGGIEMRNVRPGEEFHWLSSMAVVTSTEYSVQSLWDFKEALRKVGIRSLYYHFFTSRLRLGRKTNDFSIWIEESVGQKELAHKIQGLDPYHMRLEALRDKMIALIEEQENLSQLIDIIADQTRGVVRRVLDLFKVLHPHPFRNRIHLIRTAMDQLKKTVRTATQPKNRGKKK